MNIKLHNIAAGLALMSLSASTFAIDQQFIGTFKTIKNVTISEITAMVINGLQPSSGSSCTMATPAAGATFPGETVMKLANTGGTYPLAPGASNGAMSGVGCSTAIAGVPGIYEIDGAAGALVDITLTNTLVVGGLQFNAAGCAGDYNNLSDGDVCTTVAANTTTVGIRLASVTDQTVSAGQGVPVAGISRLALGGTVTSSIGLTAATPYVLPFDITVSY
jgi:hypothetical protein